MKRLICVVVTVVMLMSFVTIIPSQSLAASPKVLKLSSLYEVSNPHWAMPLWFGDELEKRTKGQYIIEYYKAGTLGKAPDLPGLCANGVVDFIFSAVAYNPNLFPLTRGVELMYITDNPYAYGAAIWDLYHNYAPLRQEWEKNGLMYAFSMPPGNMAVQATVPINTMADMKGLKFRTVSVIGKMVQKWGGIPVLIAYPEIYEGLNRGLIQGAFGIPYPNIYVSRFWEVAPYVIDTGIGAYGLTYTAISKKTYESFPQEIKKIVDQLREDTNAQHRKWFEAYEKEVTEKLIKEKSIQLITWNTEEKARAKNLAVPFIWEDWLNEMKEAKLPGEEFLNHYKKVVAQYEAKYSYRSPYDYFRTLKR